VIDVDRIAIVDTVCPRPYSFATLSAGALGGAEASVVRIAEGLGAHVFQHNRTNSEGRYHSIDSLNDPSVLIVLRDPKAAVKLAHRFPHAKLLIWMHDLIEPGKGRALRLRSYQEFLADRNATIVAVSDFHKLQIDAALSDTSQSRKAPRLRTVRIYNPVCATIPGAAQVKTDVNQLIFFSTPVKGLEFAMFIFRALRRRWPDLRLLVANPGYASGLTSCIEGIVNLGTLPQAEVLAHVSTSLCTFCPNFEYPETFGLVLAESNAVATPVIAHPIGAAVEVIGDSRQIVAVPGLASFAFRVCQRVGRGHAIAALAVDLLGGFGCYIDRIESWRNGSRPRVEARKSFAIDTVLGEWRFLLGTCA